MIIKWSVLILLLLGSLMLFGCATAPTDPLPDPPPPPPTEPDPPTEPMRPGRYPMKDGMCSDRSVVEKPVRGFCYTLEGLDNTCKGGANYFEVVCDEFGFGLH